MFQTTQFLNWLKCVPGLIYKKERNAIREQCTEPINAVCIGNMNDYDNERKRLPAFAMSFIREPIYVGSRIFSFKQQLFGSAFHLISKQESPEIRRLLDAGKLVQNQIKRHMEHY